MNFVLLMALSLTAQESSMQFENTTGDQVITVKVWCEADNEWANDGQEIVVDPDASVSLPLHPGIFRVVAWNQFDVEKRAKLELSAGEVDHLVMLPAPFAPPGQEPVPSFVIEVRVDETSWRQERGKAWLWATVPAMTTVFTIARHRSAEVAKAMLGTQDGPIAVTDRFGAYGDLDPDGH